MINLFNYENKKEMTEEEIKIAEYEKKQREIYGISRKYYRWDLAKDFFRLTQKEFKEAYGFSDFYPNSELYDKARYFLKQKRINSRRK